MPKKKQPLLPTSLRIVPPEGLPPPTPEEVLASQRLAAQQASKNLREAREALEAARNAYGRAVGLAREHKLPGVLVSPIRDVDGITKVGSWPGAVQVSYEQEFETYTGSFNRQDEKMRRWKWQLDKFLRDTKPK